MKPWMTLAIERAIELGQMAFTAHEELEKWRDVPFTPHERTTLGLKLKDSIQEQRKWLHAILEDSEEEGVKS